MPLKMQGFLMFKKGKRNSILPRMHHEGSWHNSWAEDGEQVHKSCPTSTSVQPSHPAAGCISPENSKAPVLPLSPDGFLWELQFCWSIQKYLLARKWFFSLGFLSLPSSPKVDFSDKTINHGSHLHKPLWTLKGTQPFGKFDQCHRISLQRSQNPGVSLPSLMGHDFIF